MTNRTLFFALATAVLLVMSPGLVLAQSPSLEAQLQKVVAGKKATVGVAVLGPNDLQPVMLEAFEKFPMQSVFKFHLALGVLQQVDQGKLALDQQVQVKRAQMMQKTWSPMLKDYQGEVFSISVEELLRYSVSHSDNNACDLLFELIGGPKALHNYLRSIGIQETAVVANERQMHADDAIQYQNWTSMKAAVQLLQLFVQKKLLSDKSQALLWQWMVETTTGPKRLKGLLPADVIVAHKTGTSGVRNGMTAATNDIGVLLLPDGRPLLVAVLVKDSAEPAAVNEAIIARIAQVAYQHQLKLLALK